jgi:hypothetical protein
MCIKNITISRMTLVGVAACSVVLYCIVTLPKLQGTSFDDAYMFLRYAKHWLSGMGFSWNPSEGPAYGITSVSYLLLVTSVRSLTSLPDPLVLTSISFVAGLASVAVLTVMGFVFFKQLRSYWLPLLVIPLVVLGQLFAFHSASGMETTLALLVNSIFASSVLYFAERRSSTSLVLCLVAAYASFLTRPDAGLYCLLLPPLFLIADDVGHWRHGVLYVTAFAILLCVDLLFKKAMLGDFLPLPFFAKSTGFYSGYLGAYRWNAAHETLAFFRESIPYLLVMVCYMTQMNLRRLGAIFLPMFLTFCYYATVTQIGGANARYYYSSLPFLILGAFIVANSSLEHSIDSPRKSRFHPLRVIITAVLLVVLTSPLADNAFSSAWQNWVVGESTPFIAQKKYATQTTARLTTLSRWRSMVEIDSLLQHLPPDVVLASSEYGYIGSQHPAVSIIDLVGLHDRYVARHGFSADYLFSKKPDIIWFPHPDYTFVTKEILDSKAFVENYDYYPNAYDYGLAVLKNSDSSANIHNLLEKEFMRIYSGRVLSDYKAEPLALYGK